VGTAAMACFVVARILNPDSNIVFIWANAYTWWIYLPAYGVFGFALLFRRRWLLGAAGVVAIFHVLWILPDYRPADDIPAEAASAPRIRLVTANAFGWNGEPHALAAELIAAEPDILFVQELIPEMQAALREAGADERFPYREIALLNQNFALAMYSRFPLEDVELIDAGGKPFLRATVEVDGNRVRLYDVHPTSPGLGRHLADSWNREWRTITEIVEADTLPLILAGDFNMTQHHRWYRELKSDGFANCHEDRGRGNATTWPQMRKLRPIRLDHVFYSGEVVCLAVREGTGRGSDHKPVIADLAILPAP
jgi:endonuclease/exonuclease/phosphatase (EEP) superfamily protein YafD